MVNKKRKFGFENKRKISFKGKYCTGCGSVWEMPIAQETVGIVIKHPDFPSYGLERENCPSCVKGPPKVEPGILTADKHKKLLQRLADENEEMLLIKKFKQNVKK